MVVDTTNPTITHPADGTVECPAMPVFTSPSSSDTCNSSSVVLDSDTSTAGCGNTYTRTKTWHAVDACNNTSGKVHQTIMVVDTTQPTITQQADRTGRAPVRTPFTDPSRMHTSAS